MLKVGILGGGQLGRMLLQAAANYPVETFVMESDPACPAAHLCHHFTTGDIRNFNDVYQFGKQLDALTIEIESVNIEALEQLEAEGLAIYPRPAALRIIGSKIRQNEFYQHHQIPSSAFIITHNKAELQAAAHYLPAVHKLATGGYDGRGVQLIKTPADIDKGFDAPAVLEKMVNISKEIAAIVAINAKGETALYPPVEMVFDPILNLLDYQLCPADIPESTRWRIEAIALKVARELQSPGLFAVEMFINAQGEVLVNETAPRVHNSGHHTIEASFSSQFDMLWRIIAGYPLGHTESVRPSILINLLGAEGHSGPAQYEGLHAVLQIEQAFVHIYGKKETKPGRKMGHITITGHNKQDLLHQAAKVKQMLRVTAAKNEK
jgi:5-(carboxyamino)imidazole ribonucleotide synthase